MHLKRLTEILKKQCASFVPQLTTDPLMSHKYNQYTSIQFWYNKFLNCDSDLIKQPQTMLLDIPYARFGKTIDLIENYKWSDDYKYQLMLDLYKTELGTIQIALEEWGRVFVRTYFTSAKHHIKAPYVTTLREAMDRVLMLAYHTALVDIPFEGLALRKFIPDSYENTFDAFDGLPIRAEKRILVETQESDIVSTQVMNYWPEKAIEFFDCPEVDDWKTKLGLINLRGSKPRLLDKASNIAVDAYLALRDCHENWVFDLMLDDNNEWWLIDVSVAEVSYLDLESSRNSVRCI